MTELVRKNPVGETWKLRAVDRTFDTAITHHVLDKLPRKAFESRVASRILRINLAYYLAVRVQAPQKHDERPELLKKIGMMAEYLYRELEAEDVNDKWMILMKLVKAWHGRYMVSTLAVASSEKDMIERDFGIEDQVVASLAIGDAGLVDETLPNLPAATDFGIYSLPLVTAVVNKNLVLLNMIMGQLNSDRSKSQSEKKDLVLGESAFSVNNALRAAIERDRIIFFRRLLDFPLIHVTQPTRKLYNELLLFAVMRDADPEYVRAILDAVAKDQNKWEHQVPHPIFRHVCLRGAEETIVALVVGGMNVHSTKSQYNPLVSAIRSGSERSIDAVLTAGADIDLPVYHLVEKQTMTALEYASATISFYKTPYWAVDSLLSHGAALPALAEWPLRKDVYNKYRDAKYLREDVLVVEWEVFRDMTDAERAAL